LICKRLQALRAIRAGTASHIQVNLLVLEAALSMEVLR
jgi:hypothetical protein